MMSDPTETFEQFKKSFWYGSRSDLGFKFLASLSDEDAAEFLRELLELLGEVFDTGEHDRVRDLTAPRRPSSGFDTPGTTCVGLAGT